MSENGRRMSATVMLVAALQMSATLSASAAIQPHPTPAADSTSAASTGAAPRLTVFGVPQNSSACDRCADGETGAGSTHRTSHSVTPPLRRTIRSVTSTPSIRQPASGFRTR